MIRNLGGEIRIAETARWDAGKRGRRGGQITETSSINRFSIWEEKEKRRQPNADARENLNRRIGSMVICEDQKRVRIFNVERGEEKTQGLFTFWRGG